VKETANERSEKRGRSRNLNFQREKGLSPKENERTGEKALLKKDDREKNEKGSDSTQLQREGKKVIRAPKAS